MNSHPSSVHVASKHWPPFWHGLPAHGVDSTSTRKHTGSSYLCTTRKKSLSQIISVTWRFTREIIMCSPLLSVTIYQDSAFYVSAKAHKSASFWIELFWLESAIFDQYLAISQTRNKIGTYYHGRPIGNRMRSVEWCYFNDGGAENARLENARTD